jgi:hypothetical protein
MNSGYAAFAVKTIEINFCHRDVTPQLIELRAVRIVMLLGALAIDGSVGALVIVWRDGVHGSGETTTGALVQPLAS